MVIDETTIRSLGRSMNPRLTVGPACKHRSGLTVLGRCRKVMTGANTDLVISLAGSAVQTAVRCV